MLSANNALGSNGTNPPSATKPTVIFVDDEERIIRSLKMMFRSTYNVKTFTDGRDALEFMRTHHVHVIVSDQRMPIITGVELLRESRKISPNSMRLLLTGYSDLAAIVGSINEGEIFRYISKPWNTDEIREIVAQAVEIAESMTAIKMTAAAKDMRPEAPERLLIIDSDPESVAAVREIVESELEQQHVIDWASDVESVFRILENSEVAVVISEMHLGEQDITPLLKTLKRYNPLLVTMVLTTYNDASALVDLINEGQVHRFLPKPVRRRLTQRSIVDAIDRYRAIKNNPLLARRHKVRQMRKPVESNLSNRIMGFVKKFREHA